MNSALVKIGAERIVSEDDASNRALLCKEQYPKVRDRLLRAHPWKFATKRASLALITPKPDNFWDFDNCFQLPTDCMRVLSTNLDPLAQWAVEAGGILCSHSSEVSVKYISRVIDVSKFDDNFCEVLAWALAADIAYAVTQSTAQKESAEKSYQSELAQARSFNAQQGSPPRVSADEVLLSRFR